MRRTNTHSEAAWYPPSLTPYGSPGLSDCLGCMKPRGPGMHLGGLGAGVYVRFVCMYVRMYARTATAFFNF